VPNTRSIQFSFAGGEVSPDMYGRIDLKSFQTGLKQCKNAVVRPQGPVKRRPGLSYCAESSNSSLPSRLIALKTDPQTIMEVNTTMLRFVRNSGVLLASDVNPNVAYGTVRDYQAPQAITVTTGNPGTFTTSSPHGFVNGDVVVFSWGASASQFPETEFYNNGFFYNEYISNPPAQPTGRLIYDATANTYYWESGTTGVLPITKSIIRLGDRQLENGSSTTGTIGQRAYYCDVENGRVTLSQAPTSFPIRRGSLVQDAYGASTWSYRFWEWRAMYSSIDRPDDFHAYNAQTQVYYVQVVSPTQFRVALTDGGTALRIGQIGTFTLPHYVMRVYLQGHVLKIGSNNYYVKQPFYAQATANPLTQYGSSLYDMGTSGELRVPLPVALTNTQLAELNYAVSNDVTTLTHRGYSGVDFYRFSDRWWASTTALNSPVPETPGDTKSRITRGPLITPIARVNSNKYLQVDKGVPLVTGDIVLRTSTGSDPYFNATAFLVANVKFPSTELERFDFSVSTLDGVAYVMQASDVTTQWEVIPSTDFETLANIYLITALDGAGVESNGNSTDVTYCNLSNRGSNVIVCWQPVAGAQQYRVYKFLNSQWGWIGDAQQPFFIDENFDPDLSQRQPSYDYTWPAAQQAVAYYEQRRVYGGASSSPAQLWMTHTNTLYSFGYHIPTKDTDRISVQLAARQNERIRHILSLSDLMILTDQGEWQVSPVNSDVITPTTISVRRQSGFGANYTVPVTLGTTAVYVTARGGHARELSYSQESRGYVTGDLSLRAAHLFDGKDMTDMSCIRAPFPVLWFVSTDGNLKGLTYIPEEKIYAWHEHVTDGVFESVASVTEGINDVLYVVVRRTINGQTKRYIERLAPLQEYGDTNVYLDSSLSGDGTNTGATTMTVTEIGLQGWEVNANVTVTRSTGSFVSTDIGDYVVIYDAAGAAYRVEIMSVNSPATSAVGKVLDAVPASVRNLATTSWAFSRNTWSGLSHLEGKTVSIWADGAMQASKVVSGGSVTIETPAIKVRIGLPYTTTIETLPIALQAEAYGQGRTKNVNKAWIRMQGTQEFQIGPTTSDLVSSGTLPSGQTDGELQVTLLPAWSQDGGILMQQSDAFPMNINGLTLEAAIGS